MNKNFALNYSISFLKRQHLNQTTELACNKHQTPLIKQIFEESKQRFGPQKIRIKLIELGYRVSEKRIREIMNNNDLKINMCVSKLIYPKPNKNKYRKNKLRRQFNQTTPNRVWVSDVTYIKVND